MAGTPQNIARTLIGGRPNDVGGHLRHTSQQGNPPQYFRGVVLEVLFDPGVLSPDDITSLKNIVSNPAFVDNMPANSLVVRLVSSGQDGGPLPLLVYPFFQSHILLPVQAGEHVQVVFEDYQQLGNSLGRWVTRIHENSAVEDLNFTHADRRFQTELVAATERTSDAANRSSSQTNYTPTFPNGGGNPDSYTLPASGSTNPYDYIFSNSSASLTHTYEAVPRFIKRPQELVLQGMNNSLIVLGNDRNGAARRLSGGDTTEVLNYAGSVDVVVGRGRYPLTPSDASVPSTKPTSGFVVQNTREKLEVDKTPSVRSRTGNPNEGNPNFLSDAARLYMCMNTKGDTNFGLVQGTGTSQTDYAANTLRSKEDGNGSEPTAPNERLGNSFLVAKSDHIRFVARKSETPDGGTIKGSVLILREGTKDTDQAYLYINQTGFVQVEAKRIFLGKAVTDATVDSDAHQEPYIKWTKFKETVDKLHEEINLLKDALGTLTQKLQQTAITSVCAPFSADPAWTSLVPQITPIQPRLVSDLASKQNEANQSVNEAKSIKIFGE